jgi:hypothetical protein
MIATFSVPVEPGKVQLKAMGYAAGNYSATCLGCGKAYNGMDKRATACRDCARKRYTALVNQIKCDDPVSE